MLNVDAETTVSGSEFQICEAATGNFDDDLEWFVDFSYVQFVHKFAR